MRALAVLAVMVYHANPSWLPGGFLGVEVFFVISGYLITLLLIGEHERSGTVSLRGFCCAAPAGCCRRCSRCWSRSRSTPPCSSATRSGQLRGDMLAALAYVSNWYQIWVGQGYTASGDFAPLRHLWSLAVEEQFYLVWPLVMIGLIRARTPPAAGDRRAGCSSPPSLITVAVGAALLPGPIETCDDDAGRLLAIAGRCISRTDTLYLSTITRGRRAAARRRLRDGLAAGRRHARADPPQGPPARPRRRRLGLLGPRRAVPGCCTSSPATAPTRGCSAAASSSPALATLPSSPPSPTARAHAGALLGNPVLRLDRHPQLRAVPLPLADLPDHPQAWPAAPAVPEFVAGDGARADRHRAVVPLHRDADPHGPRRAVVAHACSRPATRSPRPGDRRRRRGASSPCSVFAVASLATAQLRQNEIAQSLDEGAGSVTEPRGPARHDAPRTAARRRPRHRPSTAPATGAAAGDACRGTTATRPVPTDHHGARHRGDDAATDHRRPPSPIPREPDLRHRRLGDARRGADELDGARASSSTPWSAGR